MDNPAKTEKQAAPKRSPGRPKGPLKRPDILKPLSREEKKIKRELAVEDTAYKFTPGKRAAFIAELAKTGYPYPAAHEVGVSVGTVYHHRRTDPAFAEQWEKALEDNTQQLEKEAKRRAFEGILEDVYYAGKRVGQQRRFSDNLLMFLLKGRKPEVYREKFEAKFSGDIQVVVKDRFPVEDKAKASAQAGMDTTPARGHGKDTSKSDVPQGQGAGKAQAKGQAAAHQASPARPPAPAPRVRKVTRSR